MTDSSSQTPQPLTETVGRRTFLKVLGSAAPAAAVASCSPIEPERILPYVIPHEDVIPGVATWYASTCGECPAGCGTLVRTREGRAVKVEGNPEHPVNRGSLCIRGQSSLQGLYNPDRFRGPLQRRETNAAAGQSVLDPAEWEASQQAFVDAVRAAIDAGTPGRIAVVTPLVTGTLDTLVETWSEAVGAQHLRYESFAYESLRAATERVFGVDDVPVHDFSQAGLVLSFGADFQETWLSTVQHSREHAEGRRLDGGARSRHVQLEPRLSLTGAAADEWIQIAPGAEAQLAAAMVSVILSEGRMQVAGPEPVDADRLRRLVADHTPEAVATDTGVPADRIRALARAFSDPQTGPGRSLAVGGGVAATGENATAAQTAILLLNYVAGNIGATVRIGAGSAWARTSAYREMVALTERMRAGEIDVLLLHDVNPVYALPAELDFAGALANVSLVVAASSHPDETTARADLVLPTHTPLETWGDAVPRRGVRGLRQPVMRPLFDTKAFGDLLLETGRALGDDVAGAFPRRGDFFDLLQDTWEELPLPAPPPAPVAAAEPAPADADGATPDEPAAAEGEPEAPAEPDFDDLWADAQRLGGVFQPEPAPDAALDRGLFRTRLDVARPASTRALELVVYPSLHFYDGRGANRPWLQEIPDPLMKTTWGSWVEASPATAATIGAVEGQLVRLTSDHGTVDASLLVNDHVRDGVVAMPLGQGHTSFGRYATDRGTNPNELLDPTPETDSGGRRWLGTGVDATALAVERRVPRLQTTFDQDGRDVAQAVSLAALASGAEMPETHHLTLNPPHEHPIHRWGMAVDLDACNGCNACVAACYAENNVPVMGADAMRRGRTMSWLRIERFVEPSDTGVDNRFLPMLCQHCDHAPCETVCPVFATYHTDEGLNAQVYNRCVGTRYCANNCPYKVRRFNWSDLEFPEPLNLQLNPDVTGRMAGVMEKCTFCVQRITDGKDTAKDEDRPVRDGDVVPACGQTCPSQAIVFGDLNDPDSRVSQLQDDARAYRVFDVLNTRPAITYLKKVTG